MVRPGLRSSHADRKFTVKRKNVYEIQCQWYVYYFLGNRLPSFQSRANGQNPEGRKRFPIIYKQGEPVETHLLSVIFINLIASIFLTYL